jgi:hypothetical protein
MMNRLQCHIIEIEVNQRSLKPVKGARLGARMQIEKQRNGQKVHNTINRMPESINHPQ